MITRIREVRRARGMTLDDVARACVPPTTPQTDGEYRAGDEIWCETLRPDDYARALNRDVLVPRPAGRFLFGRLINRDQDKLHLLPPGARGRQQVVTNPPWMA